MKKFLSIILIVCIILSLSACGSRKNKDEDKAENDTNITSQTDNDLEDEPPFSLDAKPVDGKEYIGDGFSYVIYDDNSIEIMSYTGNKAEISIPSEINDYLVSRIASSAFENCTFLEEVNIWADVIIIGESAFKGCTNLKEISIPSSVSEIYDSTFEGCTNLKEANIWGDVIRIGVSAFKNCVSLKEISVPNSCLLVDKSAFEGCTDMEEVNLWGGEVIGECAFKNCTSLKEISIPSEVTVIKESAFKGCKSLKEVNVWGDNVTFGVNVFANCPKLEELPDGAYPDGVYSDDSSNTSQNGESNDTTSEVGVVKNIQTPADIPNGLMNDEFKSVIDLFSKGFSQSGLDINNATTYDDGETYIFYLEGLVFLGKEPEDGYFSPRIIYSKEAVSSNGTPDMIYFAFSYPRKSNGYKETVEMIEDIAKALGISDDGLIDNDYSSSSEWATGEYATFTFLNLNLKLVVSNMQSSVEIEIVPVY